MRVRIIVHNCHTTTTQIIWLSSLLSPRQAPQFRSCLLGGDI